MKTEFIDFVLRKVSESKNRDVSILSDMPALKDECLSLCREITKGYDSFSVNLKGHCQLNEVTVKDAAASLSGFYDENSLAKILSEHLVNMTEQSLLIGDCITREEIERSYRIRFAMLGDHKISLITLHDFTRSNCPGCGDALFFNADLESKTVSLHESIQPCKVPTDEITVRQQFSSNAGHFVLMDHDDFIEFIPQEIRTEYRDHYVSLSSLKGYSTFSQCLGKHGIGCVWTHQDNHAVSIVKVNDGFNFVSGDSGEHRVTTTGQNLYIADRETVLSLCDDEMKLYVDDLRKFIVEPGTYEIADFINEKPENEGQVLGKMTKVEC